MHPTKPLLLGRTDWRRQGRLFGLRQEDRSRHLYIIGQTGTGKTTLLENLIRQDLASGRGLVFLDPHGDAASSLVRQAQGRGLDPQYLDLANPTCSFGFNPLAGIRSGQQALAANGIVEALRLIWDGKAWGAKMEHLLRNGMLTLVSQPQATLSDLNRLFLDKDYREQALTHVEHPPVLAFWEQEFKSMNPRQRSEALMPIWNKLGAFLAQPALFRVLESSTHHLVPRDIIDQGACLIVNLAKGTIGADGASLLGSLLVSAFSVAALSRADQDEASRTPFCLYLDEFHNFSTLAFADMLSELRKYSLELVIGHQFLGQLSDPVRKAIMGNVGSVISFRVGPEDARGIVRYFEPEFDAQDLIYLPNHACYVRLLVEGRAVRPFSARTLAPLWDASESSPTRSPDKRLGC